MEYRGVFDLPLLLQPAKKTFDARERPRRRGGLIFSAARGQPGADIARFEFFKLLQAHRPAQVIVQETAELPEIVLIGDDGVAGSALDVAQVGREGGKGIKEIICWHNTSFWAC